MAAKRAIEQSHPTPLFHDPYAAALAGAEVENLLNKWREVAHRQNRPLEEILLKRTRYIAIRTRFFDDLLKTALAQISAPQMVILGSGLDTRAYRFHWPFQTHVFEVDVPAVLRYKTRILKHIVPTCYHSQIEGDLENPQMDWVTDLLKTGLSTEHPIIWLLEGVLMYLSHSTVHSLLRTISALSRPGSVLGMDSITTGSIAAAQKAQKTDRGRVIRYWQFGCDEPQTLLQKYDWSAEVSRPQDTGNAYERYPQSMPIEAEIGGQLGNRGVWLVRAKKES